MKRSNCSEHSKMGLSNLAPSWALQNPCQQGLVAAKPRRLAQSRRCLASGLSRAGFMALSGVC